MNAAEGIANILREAQKAVDAAKIKDPELKQIAFREAIALAAGGAPAGAAVPPAEQNQSVQAGTAAGSSEPITSIAQRLEITYDEADRIFHVDGEELELTVPVPTLSSQKRTATREIAILVTAGRQAAGLDDRETDADAVRVMCDHYKKLDAPNFSSTVRNLNGVLTLREKGRKKYLKMTQPAWEEASQLAKRVVGRAD